VVNVLRNFVENISAATPLEVGLIAAVVAVAFVDVLVSRGPNMSGEISQVSFR
jgi:Flp pilus assembly pilin Flp